MKYADIKYFDVLNGTGVRVSIFVSGCSHYCEHCFNTKAWDPEFGVEFDRGTIQNLLEYVNTYKNIIQGISILGGDPTYKTNIEPLKAFILEFRSTYPDKNIWIWSGYTWEQILQREDLFSLISLCDILVDGKFDLNLKDLNLKYRGSSNQRVIGIQESICSGEIVLKF